MADFEVDRQRRSRVATRRETESNNSELNSLATMYYRLLFRHKKQVIPHSPGLLRRESRPSKRPLTKRPVEVQEDAKVRTLSPPETTRKLLFHVPRSPLRSPKDSSLGRISRSPAARTPIPELRPRKLVPFRENFYQQSVKLKTNHSHESRLKRIEPSRNTLSVRKHRVRIDVDLRHLEDHTSAKPWSIESSGELGL